MPLRDIYFSKWNNCRTIDFFIFKQQGAHLSGKIRGTAPSSISRSGQAPLQGVPAAVF